MLAVFLIYFITFFKVCYYWYTTLEINQLEAHVMNENYKIVEAWKTYRKNYTMGSWWLVFVPSLVVGLITGALTANIPYRIATLLTSLISLFMTVYIQRLYIQLYYQKRTPNILNNLNNLNYGRDFLATFRSQIPNLVSQIIVPLVMSLGFSFLLFLNVMDADLSAVDPNNPEAFYSFTLDFIENNGLGILIITLLGLLITLLIYYFFTIRLSGIPFLAARNSHNTFETSWVEVQKFAQESIAIFGQPQYRSRIFKTELKIGLVLTISTLLFFFPLIFTIPFCGFYRQHVYLTIFEENGYDMSSWILDYQREEPI